MSRNIPRLPDQADLRFCVPVAAPLRRLPSNDSNLAWPDRRLVCPNGPAGHHRHSLRPVCPAAI